MNKFIIDQLSKSSQKQIETFINNQFEQDDQLDLTNVENSILDEIEKIKKQQLLLTEHNNELQSYLKKIKHIKNMRTKSNKLNKSNKPNDQIIHSDSDNENSLNSMNNYCQQHNNFKEYKSDSSDIDYISDSDDNDFEKLQIKMKDLEELDLGIKDCCNYYYHKKTNSIYNKNCRTKKWSKPDQQTKLLKLMTRKNTNNKK